MKKQFFSISKILTEENYNVTEEVILKSGATLLMSSITLSAGRR